MGAIDPLHRRGQGPRRNFRTVEPIAPSAAEEEALRPAQHDENPKCSYRPSDADFFCWKYGVWYNVMDCCYRHERRTFSGCAGCLQGAGNLKVHRTRYLTLRPHRDRSGGR